MQSYLACSLFVFAACGGSNLDPGSGSDPGGGTKTLAVDGSVSAHNKLVNAQTSADFDTDFSVQVTLGTQPVTTGTVTITTASGAVPLTFQAAGNGQNDRWTGTAAGYDEVYILDIVSGTDKVSGVRVDGPDIHVFTAPTAGATVDSTMPLDVAWARGDAAQSASIRSDQLDALAIPDTGEFSLTAGSLKADRQQAKVNTLRITRTNSVTPAGAVGGSAVSVSIQNEIEVVAQPNPAL
jgi:hypothetical protein